MRPLNFNDFVGQTEIVDNLKVSINGARRRDEPLDHVLFTGPPGLGKTTLSQIIANEMGYKLITTSGLAIKTTSDLASLLIKMEQNTVLFIDEIHRMHNAVEELLYVPMEDFKLDVIVGNNLEARTVRYDLPRFTVVGATTRPGMMTKPLRDRFGITAHIRLYTVNELTDILLKASQKINVSITYEAAREIAKRSRGTPRIALNFLKRTRDHGNQIGIEEVNKALNLLGIDSLGLNHQDRNYIKYLAQNPRPVGLGTIAAALNDCIDSIQETIEPYLLQIGFIHKVNKGRMLTKAGREYAA